MKQDIEKKLNKYGQSHIIKFYEELSDKERLLLEKQIECIDLSLINELYNNKSEKMTEEKIEPIQYSIMKNIREDEKLTYKKIGEKAIKDGKIAVCQMAGGQRNKTRT